MLVCIQSMPPIHTTNTYHNTCQQIAQVLACIELQYMPILPCSNHWWIYHWIQKQIVCLRATELSFFCLHFFVESFPSSEQSQILLSIIILFTYWCTSSNICCLLRKKSSTKDMGESSRWTAPSQICITKDVSYILSTCPFALITIVIIPNDWSCVFNIFSIVLNRKHYCQCHWTLHEIFEQYLLFLSCVVGFYILFGIFVYVFDGVYECHADETGGARSIPES